MLRLLLVESQPAVRQSLRLLLDAEADLQVIAEASDCESALSLLTRLQSDVVVLDVDCPHFDQPATPDLLGQIARHAPVILLTLRDNRSSVQLAEQLGGVLVVKSSPACVLLNAIRQSSRRN